MTANMFSSSSITLGSFTWNLLSRAIRSSPRRVRSAGVRGEVIGEAMVVERIEEAKAMVKIVEKYMMRCLELLIGLLGRLWEGM